MAIETKAVGKTYPPTTYAVGREKIKEYALAVGETNPLHLDHEAARKAGYEDVVAPPMFCVVYKSPAMAPAIFDAGDEIQTTVTVKSIDERDGKGFYVFESVSRNQRDETVCVGTRTNIVRGV